MADQTAPEPRTIPLEQRRTADCLNLLGRARMVLDYIAADRYPDPRQSASDMAQYIVDAIGHSVTDLAPIETMRHRCLDCGGHFEHACAHKPPPCGCGDEGLPTPHWGSDHLAREARLLREAGHGEPPPDSSWVETAPVKDDPPRKPLSQLIAESPSMAGPTASSAPLFSWSTFWSRWRHGKQTCGHDPECSDTR